MRELFTAPVTLAAAAGAALILIASTIGSRRRGLGRWSLLPYDYLMLLSAATLLVALAHLARLWRDGLFQ